MRESKRVGGQYDKNEEIFDTVWDCVIVDEAHEGTQTALGEDTIAKIVKNEKQETKFLALSGTPFNIVSEYDDDSIYTWDYIMEQESKYEWDKKHFGDSNPYEELPEMRIYTYDLGDLLNSYTSYDDKAFNFSEFFRTWTGDYELDYADMPPNAQVGDFVHEKDVLSFLNLMTKKDENSNYPFSREEYRQLFHHTLWMIPGVREAKALKNLMSKHPVFGLFNIVNVAGSDDEESKDALNSVRKAIKDAEDDGFTITLSCGKLTTGVTVREWTGVFMLSGSYSTSAANYLQTIFRVQSPCNKNGKIKELAYVFDFAPDRTLKMVADAVSISTKAGKSKLNDKNIMGKFLNYCSVISISGSEMKEYSASRLLQQLKRAYADKVVQNGFDDTKIYNNELLNLSNVELEQFKNLKQIIGSTPSTNKLKDVILNDQGLTQEQREEKERLSKKKQKDLSPEEKKRLEELKQANKNRASAISILRGISIRMPLLIYGADLPYTEDITLEKFVDKVDDTSWEEFMPQGVTKEVFKNFQKYYDEEVFISAGRKIRDVAKEADTLEPTERVMKIASLFSYFKNPDKETVLTPWRTVNIHLSSTIGGWDFFDEEHKITLNEPRFVEVGEVTRSLFCKKEPMVLEINSKTGLYPLYATYSIYREKLERKHLGYEGKKKLWLDTVQNNVFVICKTPMAKFITKRTLLGFTDGTVNAKYFENLNPVLEERPKDFIDRITDKRYWNKAVDMKFDAIIGNPPYMVMDGGAQASAKPIYHHFIQTAKLIKPSYSSFIIPTRWYAGGKGLDEFRDNMLNDEHLRILNDCLTPDDVFPNTNIRGGVCWFLWDKEYNNKENLVNVITREHNTIINNVNRPMKIQNSNFFIRDCNAIGILAKVTKIATEYMSDYMSARKPFGIGGTITSTKDFHEEEDTLLSPVKCYVKGMKYGYIEEDVVKKGTDLIKKYKVFTPRANNIGTELNDDNLNTFIGKPNSVCSEAYMVAGTGLDLDENGCQNLCKYFKTKTARYLHGLAKASQDATSKTYQYVPLQDFTNGSDINWDEDISSIDKQLFQKYGFSEHESEYIERKIKSMN